MSLRRICCPPRDQGFALGTERCGCLGKHTGRGGHRLEAHRCQRLSTPRINRGGGVGGYRPREARQEVRTAPDIDWWGGFHSLPLPAAPRRPICALLGSRQQMALSSTVSAPPQASQGLQVPDCTRSAPSMPLNNQRAECRAGDMPIRTHPPKPSTRLPAAPAPGRMSDMGTSFDLSGGPSEAACKPS